MLEWKMKIVYQNKLYKGEQIQSKFKDEYKCTNCGKTFSDLDHHRFDGLCPYCLVGGAINKKGEKNEKPRIWN